MAEASLRQFDCAITTAFLTYTDLDSISNLPTKYGFDDVGLYDVIGPNEVVLRDSWDTFMSIQTGSPSTYHFASFVDAGITNGTNQFWSGSLLDGSMSVSGTEDAVCRPTASPSTATPTTAWSSNHFSASLAEMGTAGDMANGGVHRLWIDNGEFTCDQVKAMLCLCIGDGLVTPVPTNSPTRPTTAPSLSPSQSPVVFVPDTDSPSDSPSLTPTTSPSRTPSVSPSLTPTMSPVIDTNGTAFPTASPIVPTDFPTASPTVFSTLFLFTATTGDHLGNSGSRSTTTAVCAGSATNLGHQCLHTPMLLSYTGGDDVKSFPDTYGFNALNVRVYGDDGGGPISNSWSLMLNGAALLRRPVDAITGLADGGDARLFWSGSNADGTVSTLPASGSFPIRNCNDWTSATGFDYRGQVGDGATLLGQ